MTRDLLWYPASGDRSDEVLVGAWALYLLAGLVPVLPLLPYVGYLVRVLAASASRDETAPVPDDPRALISQGVVVGLVAAAYLAVPVAVTAGTAGGLARAPRPTSLPSTLVVLAGGSVLLGVVLGFSYLLPASLTAYGVTGDWRRSFDRTALRLAGTHGAYFYRWWLGAVAFVAGTAVAGTLWSLGPVGRAVAPLPAVYCQVLACHLWGVGTGMAIRGYLGIEEPADGADRTE
jgi:hypothetical protein